MNCPKREEASGLLNGCTLEALKQIPDVLFKLNPLFLSHDC